MTLFKSIVPGLLLYISITGNCLAQQSGGEYASPLDIPLSLAGNCGEIRGNHFHSGLDFKTGNVTGKKVYAVEDGYVSRIYISPWGFGHALYITHPEKGTVSVYGHLSGFNKAIGGYALKQQYAAKNFSVDCYLKAGQFPVKRGDVIAYSGNTGSSGGPHLHFEIRDGATQCPINLIAKGIYKVQDNIRPQIVSVTLVEVDTVNGVPIHHAGPRITTTSIQPGQYKLSKDSLTIKRPSYFAIEVTDRKNGVPNIFGITRMQVTKASQPYFGFNIQKISFATTRYVNTLLLFPQTRNTKNDIFRTYLSPNNRLDIYTDVVRRGVIKPQDIDGTEKIEVRIWDDTGNESVLGFYITGSPQPATVTEKNSATAAKAGIPVWWLKGYEYSDSICQVEIPPRALYESMLLSVTTEPHPKQKYSDVVHIKDAKTMLQNSIRVAIKGDRVPLSLRDKALIAKITPQGNKSSLLGEWKGDYLEAKSSSFGSFCIAVDTVPPTIRPGVIAGNSISFKITDDFSGIDNWEAYADGKWILMRYEPKTATITHYFSDGVLEKGIPHHLTLTVKDGRGNAKTYKQNFTW